MTRVAESTH